MTVPTPGAPPTLRVGGDVRDALAPAMLAALPADALARFLSARRWSGARGGTLRAARVERVVPLDLAPSAALVVVGARLGDGATVRYQLPLIARDDSDAAGQEVRRRSPLAVVESAAGQRGVLADATDDPVFRAALGRALARGATFSAADGARWVAEPVGDAATVLGDTTESRVGSAEQSNTSIVYGDRAILKLFRRLEAGEHPEVEVGRFLTTRTAFRNTPALLGVLRLEEPGGATSIGGMLQRFVPGSTDAWSYALERIATYLRAPDAEAAERASFAPDARELGRVTRALHEALASRPDDPEFAPRPATSDDVAWWAAGARRSATDGLTLLAERLETRRLAERDVATARELLARREALLARVDALVSELSGDVGALVRHHGDFHLGQMLRTANGTFLVIDFEGEPARPLAARRARTSALRDVAGLLRSLAYAAAAGAVALGEMPAADARARAERWEREARSAFREGYLEGGVAGGFLPRSAVSVSRLTALFELEKLFYELAYELNNRPDWVWIPLVGVARVLHDEREAGW